jgi:PadR family transcriptional regulator, regulatory protein PadR
MKLLHLAPDIQEQILFLPPGTGLNERNLRPVARQIDWHEQRRLFPPRRSAAPPKSGSSKTGRYFRYHPGVAAAPKPSHARMLILRAIAAGPLYTYGLRVIQMTGLPSGTVYPAMRRLEQDGLVQSHWEQQSIADAEQRPPRKYYKLTRSGRRTSEAGGEIPGR